MAFGGHVVALRDSANALPHRDDRPAQLVAEGQRRVHALGRPLIPTIDVQIRAADARGFDLDQDLVRLRCGDGKLVEDEARPGLVLANGAHRLHGETILPRRRSWPSPIRTSGFSR
jgi:hypothetical protein